MKSENTGSERSVKRILLIDDDVTFADLTQRRLARLGYHVKLHGSGRGAMERLLRNGFDLVLLDVNMPDMKGPEVAGLIRSVRGDDVRVMLYSSLDVQTLRGLAERCGADGYVSKSASTREIESRIAEVLDEPVASRTARTFSTFPD